MLTRDDLQQISTLLDEKLDEKLAPIKETLQEHGKTLEENGKTLEEHGKILVEHGRILEEHGRLLKSHSRSLKSLKKNQDTMLNMLDREQMSQRNRLERVENHLQLPPLA